MIIYTTPKIKSFNPTKISTAVNYAGSKYCLAEVPDDFNPSEIQMDKKKLSFWWAVDGGGTIDTEQWDYEDKWMGGLVEGIDNIVSLTKPQNVAMTINALAKNIGTNPFELWESTIK